MICLPYNVVALMCEPFAKKYFIISKNNNINRNTFNLNINILYFGGVIVYKFDNNTMKSV